MKRIVVTCDYCGLEYELGRLGDLEVAFNQGGRNLHVGERQRAKEKSEDFFKRITHVRDACPGCMEKAAAALGLRLKQDADGYYYLKKA